MRRWIFILLCTLCGRLSLCYAQQRVDPESILQKAIENLDEELTQEAIEDLLDNPLRINQSTLLRLEEFPLFTKYMAASLYDYIKKNGAVISIYELSAVPGFNKEVAESLAPFLDLSADRRLRIRELSKILADGRSQVLLRGSAYTRRQEGYLPISKEEWEKKPNSRYIGPPGRLYAQYKFEVPGLIKFSTTTEKDPGEKFGDYLGFSLQLERLGPIIKIVAGDFTARFGQGLVLWNSPSLFSSSGSSSLIKQEFGLAAYSSTDENRAFRGIGITTGRGRGSFTLLLSSRNIDSRIIESGWTSLLSTGLHNTVTTLERRKNLTLSSAGVNFSYGADKVKGGITLAAYKYSHPYAGRDTFQKERQARFDNFGGNVGADIYALAGNFRFFGEIASDLGLHPALLAGALWRRSYNLDISLAARYYSKGHSSPFGGALSKGGKMKDEKGLDAVVNWRGVGETQVKSWISWAYGMKIPRISVETRMSLCTPLKMLVKMDIREERGAVRLHLDWSKGGAITLSARGEATLAGWKEKMTSGWMAFAEIVARLPSGFADFSARIAYFYTPKWDNRIYAYERDLLYGFSVPALYGEGFRCYLNIHLRSFRWMDFWIKGAVWCYTDRDYTGEGPSKMEGPSSIEIKGEVRFRF